jgi:arylsulfatase A-like enzyme
MVKTPNLDKLAAQSTRFTNFHVSPVCAPTRSSIMTGRYAETTGVYDTYNGGAIMATEEITIAEILRDNGYKTGIFGKWHLGDNYPFRPIDQGFTESFVFRGGGIGQPGDFDNYFAGDSAYFNPVLYRNEKSVKTNGYCSDVFTEEAISFVRKNRNKPFFAYLAFNAPHTPLQVPTVYIDKYKNLTAKELTSVGKVNNPSMTPKDMEDARKVYGMMTNIDDNIGKLLLELEKQDLRKNTIVLFMSDNGPQQNRYKMGLRGKKGQVYQGGIQSPCWISLPGVLPANREISQLTAHIDLLPTLLELCYITFPFKQAIDGKSMVPLLRNDDAAFKNRTLFFEWGRGFPIPYQNFTAMNERYKLVGNTYQQNSLDGFELFDLQNDPAESKNILQNNLTVAGHLKKEMETWYVSTVSHPNNLKTHAAIVGTQFENPVVLNRNDAKGEPGIWAQEEIYGYWDIAVAETGRYAVSARFIKEITEPGTLYLKLYPYQYATTSTGKTAQISLENINLRTGNYRLEIYFQTKNGKSIFPLYTSIERTDTKP